MKQKIVSHIVFVAMTFILMSCSNEMELITKPETRTTYIGIDEARSDLASIIDAVDNSRTRNEENGKRRISQEFTLSKEIQTRSDETDSISLYLFNFEDENGYALMSGDTRLPSLLVLTEEGNLQPNSDNVTNSGIVAFYDGLNRIIKDLTPDPGDPIGPGIDDYYYTYGPWETVVHRNNAFCKVKWDQNNPYNKVIKEWNGGRNVLTGCVATAVAQLMSVNKYPSTYEGHQFDWNKMTCEQYAKDCSEDAQYQIAMLMAQLGLPKNLNMNYGEEASGAKSENISRT